MDTRYKGKRKLAAFVLTTALLICIIVALSYQFTLAEDNDDEKNGDRPEITVEVVEDIPAAEIEEQEVPLADTSQTAAADNTRTTVIMWTLGAVIIAYTAFLISGMRLRKTRRRMQAGTAADRGSGPEER